MHQSALHTEADMLNGIYNKGAYPTMITPYLENGEIDFEAVNALTEWYYKAGCDGIFASCQSSEIWFLNEDERVSLAEAVVRKARELEDAEPDGRHMSIVASGHVSNDFESQVRELSRIAGTGVDAVILITNRLDIENTSDEKWIDDCEKLINRIPSDVALGLYECPYPYKRLLTPAILNWCLSTGRFRFIKDTCCDAAEISRRMDILRGTNLLLFNANAQTLMSSLRDGAAGYCGVMANFHPSLYVKLTRNFDKPGCAELVSETADMLSLFAFTESLAYPITAKYHHSVRGVPMTLISRSRRKDDFTPYHAMCVDQLDRLASALEERWGLHGETR